MPLYDYFCSKCHHSFEVFLKLSESDGDLTCPQCGAGKPKKHLSACRTNAWSTFLDTMEKRISPEKFK